MSRGTCRLVAIDYDAAIGQRLRTAFQEPEYDFYWFADGREALRRLHEIRPDVIVCDLMLPGLDGRAVLEAVKRSPELRDVPFLVLSGVRSEATIRATLDAGAQAFLVKPCPVSQLKQTIHRVLEETSQQPKADLGEAPRRPGDGLRLIPTGSPGSTLADSPTDWHQSGAGTDAPIVYEGRISTLGLDGTNLQVKTVAEGGPQDVVITTTVLSDGKELRKAESRLPWEDAKTLKELLDAQHARALEALRRLHAQNRLRVPLGEPAPARAAEPQNVGDPLPTMPSGRTADRAPAPAESPEVEVPRPLARPAGEPPPTRGPGSIDVPLTAPQARQLPRIQPTPVPVAPDTVLLKPAQGKGPASPEAEILLPYKEAAPVPVPLDTVLLEHARGKGRSPLEGQILTDSPPPPARIFQWRYLPRAAAALLAVGVLAILLEGPSDTQPPEAAPALSPEPSVPPEPSPSSVTDPTPIPGSSGTPRVTEAPAAPGGSPAAAADPAAAQSQRSQEGSDRMVRGRLQWAQALYDRGRYDEARTALSEVFKLAPSNAQARQLAAQLEHSVSGTTPLADSDSASQEDHRAILALLGRYETALEQGDVTSLKAIWPTVDPQDVRERWQSLRSWQLALRLIDLEVSGDVAVALCVSYDDLLTIDGEKIKNSSRVSFYLRRENGSWIIDAVK